MIRDEYFPPYLVLRQNLFLAISAVLLRRLWAIRSVPCRQVGVRRLQTPTVNGPLRLDNMSLLTDSPIVNSQPRRPPILTLKTPYHK